MDNKIILPTTNATSIKASQWARLEYKGEPKLVKKARPVSDALKEKIEAHGFKVFDAGSPLPKKWNGKICYKVSASKILFGKGIKYLRMVKKTAERAADMVIDYQPTHREMGYFPIFEELFFVKNDYTRMYMRAYGVAGDTSKPTVEYFMDDTPVPVWEIVQWLPSDEFNKYNGTEKPVALKDDDGNFVIKQDENGNPCYDADGNPILVPFPSIKLYKLFDPCNKLNQRPLKVIINGVNIINNVLQWDKVFTAENLENIKNSYEARFTEAE